MNRDLHMENLVLRQRLAKARRAAGARRSAHLLLDPDLPTTRSTALTALADSVAGTHDLDVALREAVECLLDIFECDRVWIQRVGESGALCVEVRGQESSWEGYPLEVDCAPDLMRALGASSGVLTIARDKGVPARMLALLTPRLDTSWILGLDQCSRDRVWSNAEQDLCDAAAQRLSGELGQLLNFVQLKQSEERLRLALDSVQDGVWDWDIGSGRVIFSKVLCQMLGFELHEFEPHVDSWRCRVHRDDLAGVQAARQAHLASETEHYSIEYRLQTKSGSWLWVLDRGKVVSRDERGAALRMIGTHTDISNTRNAEAMLLRERRFFTGGPCVVFRWVATEGWPVEYVSPNVIEFLGHSDEDFMSGRVPYSTVVHPDDLERVAAEVAAHSEAGDATFEQEYRVLRPTGEVRWLYDFTVIHRDDAGSITHYEGYVLDSTERKLAEQERQQTEIQVQHAQKLESLGVLAGGIAHDFNNLLMGVLGHADLALSVSPVTSAITKSLHGIKDAAKQAANLTQQMLAYSGKGSFLVEVLNMNQIIEEMTRLLEVTISNTAELRYDLASALPNVKADGSQVRQVIMNLISNAAESLGEDAGLILIKTGQLRCEVRRPVSAMAGGELEPGDYIYVEVADNGCGMDGATLARIFDPFFTTKFTGRGLGLAAVQGIIRGHHGDIRVVSKLGRGTTVKILLPVTQDPLAQPTEEVLGTDWVPEGTILIVDDEDSVRQVGRLMLESLGFDVLDADSGQRALDLFDQHSDDIACVLLDLTMPNMGGDEVFRELRRAAADVKVVLSSGFDESDIEARFAGRELTGFVQKPYGRSRLAEVMRDALR